MLQFVLAIVLAASSAIGPDEPPRPDAPAAAGPRTPGVEISIAVTSGLPSPSWRVEDPTLIDIIAELIEDAPPADGPPPASELAERTYMIVPDDGVDGLADLVTVGPRTIRIIDGGREHHRRVTPALDALLADQAVRSGVGWAIGLDPPSTAPSVVTIDHGRVPRQIARYGRGEGTSATVRWHPTGDERPDGSATLVVTVLDPPAHPIPGATTDQGSAPSPLPTATLRWQRAIDEGRPDAGGPWGTLAPSPWPIDDRGRALVDPGADAPPEAAGSDRPSSRSAGPLPTLLPVPLPVEPIGPGGRWMATMPAPSLTAGSEPIWRTVIVTMRDREHGSLDLQVHFIDQVHDPRAATMRTVIRGAGDLRVLLDRPIAVAGRLEMSGADDRPLGVLEIEAAGDVDER